MDPNGSLDRTSHAIFDLFCRLGICDEESVQPYYPKVRDRDDISVYRCNRSGVLLLSRSDHLSASHYVKKTGYRYIAPQLDRATAVRFGIEDAERRSNQIKALVSGKRWLDVGTGSGGLLDLLRPYVSQVEAVEPQEIARRALISDGYAVHDHLRHTASNQFDVVTLFHVLEHLDDPIAELEHVRRCLRDGGKVIIEVPHAEDFLLSFLGLEEFKAFTFWSEHLVLYTRLALRSVLRASGFSNILITGFQRYPLANHLHWLAKGAPAGHTVWSQLRTDELDSAYASLLASLDKTDTLIAVAQG